MGGLGRDFNGISDATLNQSLAVLKEAVDANVAGSVAVPHEKSVAGIGVILEIVNDLWNSAIRWIPRTDPLSIDLDGDGIDTVSLQAGALFDSSTSGSAYAGSVDQSPGIGLVQDTFHNQFTDSMVIAADVAALPNVEGSGRVRDLQQAASLATTQGRALKATLGTFNAAITYSAQRAQVDTLLLQWANTSDLKPKLEQRNSKITGVWRDAAQQAEWGPKLHILEAFNGRYFFNLPGEAGTTGHGGAVAGLSLNTPDANGRRIGTMALAAPQVMALQQSYDALKESVYTSLVLQTRLKPWLDSIQLKVTELGIAFDLTPLHTLIDTRLSANLHNGLADLIEFGKYAQPMLRGIGFDAWSKVESILRSTAMTPAISTLMSEMDVRLLGVGNDTCLLSKGDGQDSVRPPAHDATLDQLSNPVQLKAGVLPTEVTLSTSCNRLLAKIYAASDLVLVEHFLHEDQSANLDNPLQQIQFSDGRVWNLSAIFSRAFAGMSDVDETCNMLNAESLNEVGF